MRVPLADGTLVATRTQPTPEQTPHLLAASDVLGTGWFAAIAAEAGPGKTLTVVGDGAMGLLAVLAAKHPGAQRIIARSRHPDRQALARKFGATDLVTERGDDGVAKIKELTEGLGAHSGHRTRRHPGIDDASHPIDPPRRSRRLRRRPPRSRTPRHGSVLLRCAPARWPRTGTPVPPRTDRAHHQRSDRPG
ncbi:alcohol dehydrogenase zinc-binding domain-containing protein [Rhodococcus opacus M213]|uniref:Alcohol dehydrogenase zinc-binding domain-containing protein n=1 Tax=Rhodococcus opacus M213 TaxID=1129896 RepID=K8XHY3_RHOOP|nr:alcohol dehydrogenase zinc-binding domain-containing protein [Rhodococcus opacus M213]